MHKNCKVLYNLHKDVLPKYENVIKQFKSKIMHKKPSKIKVSEYAESQIENRKISEIAPLVVFNPNC
jgi:hypothetical protein